MWRSVLVLGQQALTAQAPAQPAKPGFGSMLMPLVLMFGVIYMFMILPNQRKDKKRKELLASLSKGDKVVTHGGVFGTIVSLSEKSIVLKVSDNPTVKMEFMRQAVSQIANAEDEDEGAGEKGK